MFLEDSSWKENELLAITNMKEKHATVIYISMKNGCGRSLRRQFPTVYELGLINASQVKFSN